MTFGPSSTMGIADDEEIFTMNTSTETSVRTNHIDVGTSDVAGDDPKAGYRSVWRHLMATEFRQGYVEAGGLGTRYVEAGAADKPTLVMLHGTGGHWETFCANIPALAEDFHCFALDMLGCGFTDKPDRPYEIADYVVHVLAFMDTMGIDTASFIGVSLGSWVTCRLAQAHPVRVQKMILNSPAGLLGLPASAAGAVTARENLAANPTWDNVIGALEHLFYDRKDLIDDLVAIRQQTYLVADGASMARTLTLFDPEIRKRNLLTTDEWSSIATPALIIAHVDSPDAYLETAHAIVELMPNATVVDVHQAAHWPHFEQPTLFNQLAVDFLTSDPR